MLKIFSRYEEIDFRQLMDVYTQWNCDNGKELYPHLPENLQILYAEQDFYNFLIMFFAGKDAQYHIWAPQGHYQAALRLEPYMDGLLIEALETAPVVRRKGHASNLINATISYLRTENPKRIYSHVHKDNIASLSVHYKCGFSLLSESATYIDGTHHDDAYTLIYSFDPAV